VAVSIHITEHSSLPLYQILNAAREPSAVIGVFDAKASRDPDWHAAFVTNQILGGRGFTSRLMKKIRSDEGLTYGVYSNLEPGTYWRGDVIGTMQNKNRSVAYALRLALDEIKKLKEQPVSEDEMRVNKDGIIEAFPSQWATKQAIATRFADEAREGWPEDWWASYREKIQAVTPADVQRMAKKLLDVDKMVIVVVGSGSEIEPGDPDHAGALKDATPLPFKRLTPRDPATLKPMP
jgi:zinc protease